MENDNTLQPDNIQETPSSISEPEIEQKTKEKNTKRTIYVCQRCGYQNKSLFEYQKHLSRAKPCAPGPELDKWVLDRSKNRLNELLIEWSETPKIKRHKKRLALLVKYITKLVLVIRNMEHIDDMTEYGECLEKLREELSGIK